MWHLLRKRISIVITSMNIEEVYFVFQKWNYSVVPFAPSVRNVFYLLMSLFSVPCFHIFEMFEIALPILLH